MIILDIETSGIDFVRNGIWQIGAIDLHNPQQQFLDECRIDDNDTVTSEALTLGGVDERYLRDKKKQSQRQLLEKFFAWCERSKNRNFICQNPQFDTAFIKTKAEKYHLAYPFHFRAFDLHSIASLKYQQLHGEFLVRNNLETGKTHSNMGLPTILKFCGMTDNRKTHNALEDCKLTGECFARIVHGKNLFQEYKKYRVPSYLLHTTTAAQKRAQHHKK